ncbi:hypothetical protein B0H15DRAFT_949427 [Mycena belliarum]|uniref:DUF6534 domain-containing protein n=1 Tax=Mycena belliarum TaxID=1033014 RepID=A0AAD6U336_9AGAR|nr:hypothetical protein B0H15DRAFT_949427 [Mycena belliae]
MDDADAAVAAAQQAAALAAAARLFTRDNTLGALLVGFAASSVVYGVLLTQAWTYFGRYNSDSTAYKLLVVLIILLESVDQAFVGHFVYYYTVTQSGNPLALVTGSMTWSVIIQQVVGSVVGTIVKCCFATRVYRFSERNIFVAGLIIILSLGELGVACVFTYKALGLRNVPEVFHLRTLATTALGLGAFTDLLTAASLFFFLRRLRTGYSTTDSLVRRLVRDAINTGFVTTAASAATVLLFNLMPTNLLFVATYFLLAKLYGISLLATLNTRRAVRGRGTDQEAEMSSSHHPRTRTRTHEETNMFHLGTRLPAAHEGEFAPREAWDTDVKPGFPPLPSPVEAYPSSGPSNQYEPRWAI